MSNQSTVESSNVVSENSHLMSSPSNSVTDTVLEKARKHIEEQTRFSVNDLQADGPEQTQLQAYDLTVRYSLSAEPTVISINGYFRPSQQDQESPQPAEDAKQEVTSQLQIAASQLEANLTQPATKYNQIEAGLLLAHPHKHWHLHTCSHCAGIGHINCGTCHGVGRVTCPSCGGSRTTLCTGSGCVCGRVSCYRCGGSGYTSRQVSRPVTKSVNINGKWVNQYSTEYHTVREHCNYCLGGKITCPVCHGAGRVNCQRCSATGKIDCGTCSGSGRVICSPCDGSGQVGIAAWVDVQVQPDYSHELLNTPPADIVALAKAEGTHGLPAISTSFRLENTSILTDGDISKAVFASYQGEFKVARQDVICAGTSAHLVAYGTDLRWWDLDRLIEKLVQSDLSALSNVIVESGNEGVFSSKADHILDKLKHVIESEINLNLVNTVLAGQDVSEYKGAVSKEYALHVSQAIRSALRRVYVRQAKGFAWKTAIAVSVIFLAAWMYSNTLWAELAAFLALLSSFVLHKLSIRKMLTSVLGNEDKARQAIGIASKGTGGREAALLLSVPSLAVACMLGWGLPAKSSIDKSNNLVAIPPKATIDKPASPPQPEEARQNAERSAAMQAVHPPKNKLQETKERIQSDKPVTAAAPTDAKLDSRSELDLHMAEKMLAGRYYRNAYDLAERVLKSYPTNQRARRIADIAQEMRQSAKSEELGNTPSTGNISGDGNGAQLDPRSETQLKIAERMFSDGYYANAIELAKRVLANHPDNARAKQLEERAQAKLSDASTR